jgi:hypothetical protein
MHLSLGVPVGSSFGAKNHARFRLSMDVNVSTDDTYELTDDKVTLPDRGPRSPLLARQTCEPQAVSWPSSVRYQVFLAKS